LKRDGPTAKPSRGLLKMAKAERLMKNELLRLAKRLRAKAAEFEKVKDYTRAEQARLYAQFLEESAKSVNKRLKAEN